MKILVVSGFLGAGKTTFIQELTRRVERQVVVYENEFGQADIDAQILENDEIRVWESLENCICCTGKQDFATSVLTIANTLDPELLIVEPTGVARLSSVVDNVNRVGYERIGLLPSVAIVGADTWTRQHDQYPEIYLDQIESAQTIVLSKTDRAGAGEVAAAAAWVRERNPRADIVDRPYTELSDAWFEGLVEEGAGSRGVPAADAPAVDALGSAATDGNGRVDAVSKTPELSTITVDDACLPTPTHLFWLLDALVAGVFGDIPRAKGILPCGSGDGEWLRFDVVDRSWAVTGAPASEDARAQAVFIGPDIKRTWLLESFSPAHKAAGHAAAGAKLRGALRSAGRPRAK